MWYTPCSLSNINKDKPRISIILTSRHRHQQRKNENQTAIYYHCSLSPSLIQNAEKFRCKKKEVPIEYQQQKDGRTNHVEKTDPRQKEQIIKPNHDIDKQFCCLGSHSKEKPAKKRNRDKKNAQWDDNA